MNNSIIIVMYFLGEPITGRRVVSCDFDVVSLAFVFSLKVIVALLKKFKVADNPRKFALFECYQEEDNHSKIFSPC